MAQPPSAVLKELIVKTQQAAAQTSTYVHGVPTLHVLCEGWDPGARVMIGACNFSGLAVLICINEAVKK